MKLIFSHEHATVCFISSHDHLRGSYISLQNRREFEQEASVLSRLEHPNIVKLFGVSVEVEPYSMIFEHMEKGDLRKYLR